MCLPFDDQMIVTSAHSRSRRYLQKWSRDHVLTIALVRPSEVGRSAISSRLLGLARLPCEGPLLMLGLDLSL